MEDPFELLSDDLDEATSELLRDGAEDLAVEAPDPDDLFTGLSELTWFPPLLLDEPCCALTGEDLLVA